MKLHIPVALVFLSALSAGPALSQHADVKTMDTDDGWSVSFIDADELDGTTGAFLDNLTSRGGRAPAAMLLRPRGTFVPEILKSVEAM